MIPVTWAFVNPGQDAFDARSLYDAATLDILLPVLRLE